MSDPGGASIELGAIVLRLARAELEHSLADGPPVTVPAEAWLESPGACFVTLTRAGRLRGCIGSIHAYRPLGADLLANTRAAAGDDPRFEPVTADELPELRIEVSRLSPLVEIEVGDEQELVGRLRPGRDGLVLAAGRRRGTFLPQVWESLPEPDLFVSRLRSKAGVPTELPAARIRWWTFTVQSWTESENGRGERI